MVGSKVDNKAGKKAGKKRTKKAGKKAGKRTKTVWKAIRVPEQVHAVLKQKAKKQKVAMHKVISQALMESKMLPYKDIQEKLTGDAKNIDRAIWYAFKLANGVAMFKQAVILAGKLDAAEGEQIAAFVNSEKEKLMRTIEQIEKRCNVNLEDVRNAVTHYAEGDGEVTTAVLNDTVKAAMIEILNNVIS